MRQYSCIDIGSTAIKAGIINEEGKLGQVTEVPSQAIQGGPVLLENVKKVIREHQAQAEISGICLSTSGMVNIEAGSILYAYEKQIPDYTGMEVKKLLEAEFGIPVEIENDVNCAALGEFYQGAGAGTKSCFMITIGTGIGGCFIDQGKVLQGAGGSAGEVGYMKLDGDLFQNHAATGALTRRCAKALGRESMNGYEVLKLAESGDPVCTAELERMVHYMALGLATICYCFNPECLILGGGIMAREDLFRPMLEKELEAELLPTVWSSTHLEFAKTQNSAGMIGAWYHFMNMQAARHAAEGVV